MGETPVTQRQWKIVEGPGKSPLPRSQENLPVCGKTQREIRDFLAKLSKAEGVSFRLATCAELSYVCKQGLFGSSEAHWMITALVPVDSMSPGWCGLRGISGSIKQFCDDETHRGSSDVNTAGYLFGKSINRPNPAPTVVPSPDYSGVDVGFRIVREAGAP